MKRINKSIFIVVSVMSLMWISCVKQQASQSEAKGNSRAYCEKHEDECIYDVIAYTLHKHKAALEAAAPASQVPRAVLLTLLARERYTDLIVYDRIDNYWYGDLVNAHTSGPANISLDAIKFVQQKHPGLFRAPFQAESAHEQSKKDEAASILWGAHYLRVIYDDVLLSELETPKKWIKAIGLYNEGISNAAHFTFGEYSRIVKKILDKAKTYY